MPVQSLGMKMNSIADRHRAGVLCYRYQQVCTYIHNLHT